MASVTVFVRPETKDNKADLRLDRRGNTFVNGQDVDTNQFVTIYPYQHNASLFPVELVGQTVVFNGTLHALGENVKMIAKTAEVVS